MNWKIIALTALLTVGCTHELSTAGSVPWDVLTQASAINCRNVVLGREHLAIDSLTSVKVDASLFLIAKVINRNGSRSYLWKSIDSGLDYSLEEFAQVSRDLSGEQMAFLNWKGELFGIARSVTEDRFELKLSSVLNDKASNYYLQMPGAVFAISDAVANKNLILLGTDGPSSFVLAYRATKDPAKEMGLPVFARKLPGPSRIIRIENNFWIVFPEVQFPGTVRFKYLKLNQDGDLLSEGQLFDGIPKFEKWSLGDSGPGQVYVAFSTGDSMVGSAQINVAQIDIHGEKPVVVQNFYRRIGPGHISEIISSSQSNTVNFLLSTWLDEEGTVVKYSISQDKNPTMGFFGVFPQGAIPIDSFTYNNSRDINVLIRQRAGSFWSYSICKIKGGANL